MVPQLGWAPDSWFARGFLQDLQTKMHTQHFPGTGHKLPTLWLRYPRAVFNRWGLFPSQYVEGKKYKLSDIDLNALDSYALK